MTDINLTINGETITEKIIGKLDVLILNIPSLSQIEIVSENGYSIFKAELDGICYIPIRVQAVDTNCHRINFSFDKINLNEKLLFKVNQFIKSDLPVKVILRIDG